jgi:hypothetical protein
MASDLYNRIQLPYVRDDEGPQGILTPAPKIVPGRDGIMTVDPNSATPPPQVPLYRYIDPASGRFITTSTPPPQALAVIPAPAVSAPASAFSFGGIQLTGTQLLIGAAIVYFLMSKK